MTQLEPGRESSSKDTRIRITRKEESIRSILFDLIGRLVGLGLIFTLIFVVLSFFHNVPDYYEYYEKGFMFPGGERSWLYWVGYYLFRAGLSFYQLGAGYCQLINRAAQSQDM